MSNYGDKHVTAQLVAKAVAFQDSRRKMKEELLTDEALGKQLGLSATWVREHVPPSSRRVSAGMPSKKDQKAAKPKEQKAAAEAQAAEAPAPSAPAAPTAEKPKLSYTAGKSCGKGKHQYVDQGNYLKCTVCNSTKTKAKPKPEKPAEAPKAAEAATATPA